HEAAGEDGKTGQESCQGAYALHLSMMPSRRRLANGPAYHGCAIRRCMHCQHAAGFCATWCAKTHMTLDNHAQCCGVCLPAIHEGRQCTSPSVIPSEAAQRAA